MIGVLRVRGARAQPPEKGLVVGGPEPCQVQAEPVHPELISAGQSVPAGHNPRECSTSATSWVTVVSVVAYRACTSNGLST